MVAFLAGGRRRPGRLPPEPLAAAGAGRRATRSSSSTRGRETGGRPGSGWRGGREARDRDGRAGGRARTWASWCARRWGGAPTAWRWPAATARRPWSRRSPPSTTFPTPAFPPGTRNHFALDLGVDREDVVGALDAFVDGGERYVDLGEVNGRVFVNNVSLGVYAEAVSQEQYRESKLRTLLDTLADTLGPGGEAAELRWIDPDGADQRSTALILVSNNAYLLGPTLGSGTRPRLDAGVLGIVDFHPPIAGESDGGRAGAS